MERAILARINDIVESHLPQAQVGFRKGRSTVDQIIHLLHDIEGAFQKKEKVGDVYIDLTAAYDTVWHRGLYLKLLQMIPDVQLVKFMTLMLQNRSFYVTTSSRERSRNRQLRNGLPQGSVLAPIVFNIYIADYPATLGNKYLYADDSAIAAQVKTYEEIQTILEADISTLCRYVHLWHLKVRESKTVCSIYHLSTRLAKKELEFHSVHTKLVDDVLNDAMRIISGTLKPTPTEALPVVSGIHPPNISCDFQILKLAEKALQPDRNSIIPIPQDIPQRISRQHFATRAAKLLGSGPASDTWMEMRWSDEWKDSTTILHSFIGTPCPTPPGHTLLLKAWVRLNCLQTGWGRTQSFLKLTGASTSDACQCGAVQSISHFINECPIFAAPHGSGGLVQLEEDTLNWLLDVAIPV
ncbi:hypothetical protein JOB18_013919 [Solea senegalensis]|uniref:Reverse transcriptase domain-containing protein n=1 Tax=Solea senegalensis TaxID=28829 RepID=A0AAV6R9M7_SOLSE|nr:hypothetical protein JOB18_013919 [Solea senegalensis]